MNDPSKYLGYIVLFSFALGVGIGFGVVAQRITSDFSGTVALGCVTLIATTTMALWQFNRTKKKEAEARIFSERSKVYQRLLNAIRNIMFASKGWIEEKSGDDLAKELSEITYEMIIWGGQDTIRAIGQITKNPGDNIAEMMRTMAQLYKAIRSDLGHNDDTQLHNDLVLQLISVKDHEEVRKYLTP